MHTGWEYAGKLWAFGGKGPLPELYLKCHGDFARAGRGLLTNNQLLSYDSSTNDWVNPQCFGAVPSPRWGHASAMIRANVYLFGGCIQNRVFTNDFFQLDMNSLTWTQLGIGQPSPQARCVSSLTATSNNQLVLHGGQSTERETLSDTWIMDGTLYSWGQYTPSRTKSHLRQNHTATLDLNNNIIIVGGCYKDVHNWRCEYGNIVHVKVEPSSLQQLASCTIYRHRNDHPCLPARSLQELAMCTITKHRDDLPWKCLPKKLLHIFVYNSYKYFTHYGGAWKDWYTKPLTFF